jgi:Tol biopolymer transport system component
MRRGTTITLTVVLTSGLGLTSTQPALGGVGNTRQVSLTWRGTDPIHNSGVQGGSISGDGRYVAFESFEHNLVKGDENGVEDVFVRAGTTVRASVDTGGGDADRGSAGPTISADGRYVAFHSEASDLVQGDGNGVMDVFVRDMVAGTTVRASVDTGGGDPDGDSGGPSISADGRYVAFSSRATDLVAGDGNGTHDVFIRDLVAGTTVRASVDTEGGDPDSFSDENSISADGRYVAFQSFATDLVAGGDGNGGYDIFVRDLVAGTTVRASVDTGGGDPDNGSLSPSISADGGYVAFESFATDLVQGDGNNTWDIFVRDLVAGTTVRASVDMGGGDARSSSNSASISSDGRYVAFFSLATDLVAGDGNRVGDVFVRDLVAGTTVRASVDTGGGDPDGGSSIPSISADGRYVAFSSVATDLVPGAGDAGLDMFLARWG